MVVGGMTRRYWQLQERELMLKNLEVGKDGGMSKW